MTRRRIAAGFFVAALAVTFGLISTREAAAPAPASLTATAPAGPLLGVVRTPARESVLTRLSPRNVRPIGGRVPLERDAGAWSFSPDRARLVLANRSTPTLGRPTSLRFVDVRRMRALGQLVFPGDLGRVLVLGWFGRHRLVVVRSYCCSGRLTASLVDPVRRRILLSVAIEGSAAESVVRWGRSEEELALLLVPRKSIGRARILTIDRSLQVRSVTLERVRAGMVYPEPGTVRQREPGFAIDPAGRRAFVVGADEPVTEVSLSSLEVRYHGDEGLLGRLGSWLQPAALAKSVDGETRWAEWVDGGFLVVSGMDYSGEGRGSSAGVSLIDTHDWSSRTLDAEAQRFFVAGTSILTVRPTRSPRPGVSTGRGLGLYGLDGNLRLEGYEGSAVVGATLVDGELHVGLDNGKRLGVRVLDPRSGRLLRAYAGSVPYVLVGGFGG